MSDTIKLKFRRGGDWYMEPGFWVARNTTAGSCLEFINVTENRCTYTHHEYAGPFTLEIEEPEPEPLRIDGYGEPYFFDCSEANDFYQLVALNKKFGCTIRVHGSTRREAIERFNLLAKAMGAK